MLPFYYVGHINIHTRTHAKSPVDKFPEVRYRQKSEVTVF